MFKVGSKRRRTKVEIEEAKEEERLRDLERDQQQQRIDELEARLRQMQQDGQNGAKAAAILSNWIEEGSVILDQNGDCVIQGGQQEQQRQGQIPQSLHQANDNSQLG